MKQHSRSIGKADERVIDRLVSLLSDEDSYVRGARMSSALETLLMTYLLTWCKPPARYEAKHSYHGP